MSAHFLWLALIASLPASVHGQDIKSGMELPPEAAIIAPTQRLKDSQFAIPAPNQAPAGPALDLKGGGVPTPAAQATLQPPAVTKPIPPRKPAPPVKAVPAIPRAATKPALQPLPPENSSGIPDIVRSMSPSKPTLPLLGKSASMGIDSTKSQQVIHLSSGVNEIVNISLTMPNRISTPFSKPRVVDNGLLESDSYKTVGSDIFVIPTSDMPIGMFIYDEDRPGANVATITLVPQKTLLAQSIVVMFAPSHGVGAGTGRAGPEAGGVASDYEDDLRMKMRSLALGVAPSGFSEANLNLGSTRVGGLSIVPERQYAGGKMYLYRYRIENITNEVIELDERTFIEDGVRAVAFYPVIRLEPNAYTWVLIAADISSSENRGLRH